MSEEKQALVNPQEECLKEINAVLQKYQFSLVPTFQFVPVTPREEAPKGEGPSPKPETTVEEVEEKVNDKGGDQ